MIRRPGRYRLDRDIQALGGQPGIEITADKVSLDLAGHSVTAAPGSIAAPTYAIWGADVSGLTVRDGTLAGGWIGLYLLRTRGCSVTGVVVEASDHIGIASVAGRNLRVADCRLTMTVKDLPLPEGERYMIGMNLTGHGTAVAGTIVEIDDPGTGDAGRPIETIGILIGAESRDVRITGNRVMASRPLPGSYGVWGGAGSMIEMSGNTVDNVDYGIAIADRAVASVADNAFTCRAAATTAGRAGCTAAMFARSADLRDAGNRIEGYAAAVTRYDPAAVGH